MHAPPLVRCAVARDASRKNLAALTHELADTLGILVVDIVHAVFFFLLEFFYPFVAFDSGQVFDFIFCHELRLHCFFGSCFYTTSLFSVVLDGVFIEFGTKVTKD